MATQAQRSETTRGAILTVAGRLFGKRGFQSTSVDEIAAAAGVAKGAVYHHFANKEQIFEAVLEQISSEVVAQVVAASSKAPDVLAAMAVGVRTYFDACATPGTAQIVLRDGPAVLGWQRWRKIDDRYFGRMIPDALKSAMSSGLLARQPLEPLATLLNGAITEAAAACAADDNPSAAGRRYANAFQALIDGLRRAAP